MSTSVVLLLSCSVMIESFISTQKTSVQKLMSKKFRHFLTHKQDLNDLVMHALQVCNLTPVAVAVLAVAADCIA